MAYSFDWSAQPELNDPKYNSPRPCNHGAHCVYDKCCAFVHPGEEGTGRKLFPAFIRKNDDGTQAWLPAAVRLIGSPSFYERRRLHLSWPEWCFRQGMPTPKPRQEKQEGRALTGERRTTINLTASASPASAPAPARKEPGPNLVAAAAAAAAAAARALGQLPPQALRSSGHEPQSGQEPQSGHEPHSGQEPGDDIRTRLYNTITETLSDGKQMLLEAGLNHPNITPAKLTGMFLDGFSLDECVKIMENPDELSAAMIKACESIVSQAA